MDRYIDVYSMYTTVYMYGTEHFHAHVVVLIGYRGTIRLVCRCVSTFAYAYTIKCVSACTYASIQVVHVHRRSHACICTHRYAYPYKRTPLATVGLNNIIYTRNLLGCLETRLAQTILIDLQIASLTLNNANTYASLF